MGDSRDFIRKIESLNRAPLENTVKPRTFEDILRESRALRRQAASPAGDPPRDRRDLTRAATGRSARPGTPVALEDALPGGEIFMNGYGKAYRIDTPQRDFGNGWEMLGVDFAQALAAAESPLQQRLAQRCHTGPITPDGVIFVDIETTGLANAPLFLIGAMCWQDDQFVVRQFLARHYDEEAAVIAFFTEHMRGKQLLVSFNGKTFDLPTMRARAVANTVRWLPEPPHFDLLHESRRVWRGRLPNCKLQTLEQRICGHPPRHGDIPGSEIPAAYNAYVRTNDARDLAQIIHHNLLDLVTLAELMLRLPRE